MMNKGKLKLRMLFILILAVITFSYGFSQRSKETSQLNIKKIELGYPSPATPFYHFKADI